MALLLDRYLEMEGNTGGWVSMGVHDFYTPDVSALLSSAETRGTDVILPGAAGTRSYPARATVTEYATDLHLVGSIDEDGAAVADPEGHLADLYEYLVDELTDPPASPRGTRAALLRIGSATFEAQAKVLRAEVRDRIGPYTLVYSLRFTLPLGSWTRVAGS